MPFDDLTTLLARHGLAIVAGVAFLARVGVPIPAAPLLVVAGGLAMAGWLNGPMMLLAAIAATVLGDALWFEAGRRFGHRVLRTLCRISLSPDSCVRQSEGVITRWGGSSLVLAKFLPGISVVAAPMAGALGMSWARFLLYDLAAGALWASLFVGLGVVFNAQIRGVLDTLATAGFVAVVGIAVAVVAFVAWRWWRRHAFLRAVAMRRISVAELSDLMAGDPTPVVIDVRSPASAQLDPRRIPGAVLVALDAMGAHAPTLPRDREIVLYCNCPHEASAAHAARVLAGLGVTRVRPLAGGLDEWAASGRPVETA